MRTNLQRSMAKKLQGLSTAFRTSQKVREGRGESRSRSRSMTEDSQGTEDVEERVLWHTGTPFIPTSAPAHHMYSALYLSDMYLSMCTLPCFQ